MEDPRMRLTLTLAAALLVVSSFALTAGADDRLGPREVAGQCKRISGNSHNLMYYTWQACPKPAAAPVVRQTARRHHG
jgi:hypothetical protein